MTDRELLELAAKAAGIRVIGFVDEMIAQPDHKAGGLIIRNERGGDSCWNPRTDDGDALRLAVKLCIEVSPCDGVILVTYPIGESRDLEELHIIIEHDRYETTRRAITRAAAEIGKTL